MPSPDPEHLPAPSELHARFSTKIAPVDWGERLPTAAEIIQLYGARATAGSLRLLERAITTEPRITAQFLEAMPPSASAYRPECRIKSPESLARRLRDMRESKQRHPPDDLLRYTALTEGPDTLVDTARETCEELRRAGWQVRYARQSYSEGSRYKGIHSYFVTPSDDRVEVQFHSVASARVKEATTPGTRSSAVLGPLLRSGRQHGRNVSGSRPPWRIHPASTASSNWAADGWP